MPRDASSSGSSPRAADNGDAVQRVYAPTDGAHAADLGLASSAFVRGDFRVVRRICKHVDNAQPSAAERTFARGLLARTAADPFAVGVAVALLALIGWLFFVST